MKKGIIWILLVVSTAAFSQTVIEKQVPFDNSGKVMVISRALRDQLRLFSEVKDFAGARLWQSDATFVLEVTHANGNRERNPLTADERDNLRQQVEHPLAVTPSAAVNQKGRGLFLLSQLPIALAWYSPAVLAITGATDVVAVGTYMVSASAFFFVPLVMTRNAPMSEAQATMSVDYGYYGVADGFALATLIGLDNLFNSEGKSPQAGAAVELAASIGGQFLGYRLGRTHTLGQARYASLLTDCGIGDGLLLGTFLQTFRGNILEGNGRLNSALTLLGSGAGSYVGYRLARKQSWSEGQAFVTGLGSICGPLVANGAFWTVATRGVASNHGFNFGSFLALGGNVAGTWYAQRLVSETPITNSGAFIATGTTIGGGLLGAGLGLLISRADKNNIESWRWSTGLGTVGLAGGFMLGVKLAKDVTASAQAQGSIRFNLDVASLAAGAVSYGATRRFSAPRLITLTF